MAEKPKQNPMPASPINQDVVFPMDNEHFQCVVVGALSLLLSGCTHCNQLFTESLSDRTPDEPQRAGRPATPG